MGPTLFLLYINSLSNLNLHSLVKLYADDTTIVYYGKTREDLINAIKSDLTQIVAWLEAHRLTLNIEKSSYMFISREGIVDNEPTSIGNLNLQYNI